MHDVIVIGGGPAGITASLYIKRAGFDVTVFSNEKSGLQKSDKIENYYGFENGISGEELHQKGIKQAKNLEIEVINKEVIGIKYLTSSDGYEIITANQSRNEKYEAKFVILATGVNRNKPNIKGLTEFEGKGISYCAVCDAGFYRGKDVAVLGSGEYAIGEIQELLPIAKKVMMLTNGENPIEIRSSEIEINKNEIEEINGKQKVEEIQFKNGTSERIDGIFIAQGTASSIDFAKKVGAKIENNTIIVDENMKTTAPNIYACGDCIGGIMQISKAVYDGTKAGLTVISQLRNFK